MKKVLSWKGVSLVLLASWSLCAVTSCGWDDDYYYSGYSGSSYGSSPFWSSAWYDSSGYPIYGYCNGRPVYGYTSTGQAVYTLSGLGSGCMVPTWNPAPWYSGHYHYVHNVVRTDRPHHCPADHRPGVRPPRPMNRYDNDRAFQDYHKRWNEWKSSSGKGSTTWRSDQFKRPESWRHDSKREDSKPSELRRHESWSSRRESQGAWRPEVSRPVPGTQNVRKPGSWNSSSKPTGSSGWPKADKRSPWHSDLKRVESTPRHQSGVARPSAPGSSSGARPAAPSAPAASMTQAPSSEPKQG